MLPLMLSAARVRSPLCTSETVVTVSTENVVYEPRNPIDAKTPALFGQVMWFPEAEMNTPSENEPVMLMKNIPNKVGPSSLVTVMSR